ncbi:hypothetical protein EUTSA_v10019526mg, partial [Eutrema salsugineum]
MGLSKIDPETEGCQRICDLPEDLLLCILLLVPTKDAVATAILSKRWRYVWKMLPKLSFKDDQGSESIGWFIDKSLHLHKAPKLISLVVELGPRCPVDLDFKLLWGGEPTSFPKSLYTCDTLVSLYLSNQILIDVSFPASLPSLLYLYQDSLARLLSSSHVLFQLVVERPDEDDNLTNFTVKVPSLQRLFYETRWQEEERDHIGSITENWGDYCSLIQDMICLDEVYIDNVPNPDE